MVCFIKIQYIIQHIGIRYAGEKNLDVHGYANMLFSLFFNAGINLCWSEFCSAYPVKYVLSKNLNCEFSFPSTILVFSWADLHKLVRMTFLSYGVIYGTNNYDLWFRWVVSQKSSSRMETIQYTPRVTGNSYFKMDTRVRGLYGPHTKWNYQHSYIFLFHPKVY